MIIYRATCLATNKIYIGKTIQSLRRRKLTHLADAKRKRYNSVFHAAIRKYGEDAFVWEVLDRVMFSDLLLDLEKFYIAKYNCKTPNGYNMTDGGDGVSGNIKSPETIEKLKVLFAGKGNPFYGKHHTDKTKELLSKIRTGKKRPPFTERHRNNIRLSLIGKKKSLEAIEKNRAAKLGVFDGNKNPFWGKKHSPETINKIRIAKLGKKLTEEHKQKISKSLMGNARAKKHQI